MKNRPVIVLKSDRYGIVRTLIHTLFRNNGVGGAKRQKSTSSDETGIFVMRYRFFTLIMSAVLCLTSLIVPAGAQQDPLGATGASYDSPSDASKRAHRRRPCRCDPVVISVPGKDLTTPRLLH
jgi:hypothetical protein